MKRIVIASLIVVVGAALAGFAADGFPRVSTHKQAQYWVELDDAFGLIQGGDLKIAGTVEGELKVSGDVLVDSTANVQASIEGANVNVRGQVNGNVTARKRLTLGGSGRLNGEVRVARLTVEDGATLNGNVTMTPEKG